MKNTTLAIAAATLLTATAAHAQTPHDPTGADFLIGVIKHNPTFLLLAGLIGVPSLVLSLVALTKMLRKTDGARKLGILSTVGACAAAGMGVAGCLFGRHGVEQAIAAVTALSESEVARLRALGYLEAHYQLWIAFAIAALPLVLGIISIVGARRSQDASA